MFDDYHRRRSQLITDYQQFWQLVDFITLSPDALTKYFVQANYLSTALPNQTDIRLVVMNDNPVIDRYRQAIERAIEQRHPQHLYHLWQWSQVLDDKVLALVWEASDIKPWLEAAIDWHRAIQLDVILTWPDKVMDYFIKPRIIAWERHLRRRKTPAEIAVIQRNWLDDIIHLQLMKSDFYQKRHAKFLKEVDERMKTYRFGERRQAWQNLLLALENHSSVQ